MTLLKLMIQIYCEPENPPLNNKLQSEQMEARKKEMLGVQHPRMTNVFDQRNTKQSQKLLELRSKDFENGSEWYVWGCYVDFVTTLV